MSVPTTAVARYRMSRPNDCVEAIHRPHQSRSATIWRAGSRSSVSMSGAMGSFRGTVVAFPDLGVTPGLGRTTAWSVASYRHDAVS
jgi:hypothetical protein